MEDQSTNLELLIAELETLPTPELIREACRLVALDAQPEELRKRMEAGMDAAISAQLLLAYLEVLRRVEDWRMDLGIRVHTAHDEASEVVNKDPERAVKRIVQASQWVGEQDVIRHFWVVAVGRIQRSLEVAARQTGFRLNPRDSEILDTYREMRDFYEHMERELPGGKSNKRQTQPDLTDENRIRFGLSMDEEGRTILGEIYVDITGRGLEEIENLVKRVHDGIRAAALAKVKKYYHERPETAPSVTVIDSTLINSVKFLPEFV